MHLCSNSCPMHFRGKKPETGFVSKVSRGRSGKARADHCQIFTIRVSPLSLQGWAIHKKPPSNKFSSESLHPLREFLRSFRGGETILNDGFSTPLRLKPFLITSLSCASKFSITIYFFCFFPISL